MYFAPGPTRVLKLKFPADPEHVSEHAETIVQAALMHADVELDYSPRSITDAERILDGFRKEGTTVDDVAETLFSFGCYVGEVIREVLQDAEWIIDDRKGLVLARPGVELDPIRRVYAFVDDGLEASIAMYVAGIIGRPLEVGATPDEELEFPDILLRAVGLRLGATLLAMQENGVTSERPAELLRVEHGEVIDDPWTNDDGEEDDEQDWRQARELGVARALIRGPGSDAAGFLTLIVTLDAGTGAHLHCAIPTLPVYRDAPFKSYALQADRSLSPRARAEIQRGIALVEPALASDQEPPRAALRIEHLGVRVARVEDYVYAVDARGVYRERIVRVGELSPTTRAERVLDHTFDLDDDGFYFVDMLGDVVRTPRYQLALAMRWSHAPEAERVAMLWRRG